MARTGVGCRWQPELTVYKDAVSGATVHQMTSYKGHSHHFYFTYPCWYDSGRKIVIFSDRDGRTNLFGVDLAGGEITQLTDARPGPGRDAWAEQESCPRRSLLLPGQDADGA